MESIRPIAKTNLLFALTRIAIPVQLIVVYMLSYIPYGQDVFGFIVTL